MNSFEALIYFLIFVAGVVIGRISMAVQYALMKTAVKKK